MADRIRATVLDDYLLPITAAAQPILTPTDHIGGHALRICIWTFAISLNVDARGICETAVEVGLSVGAADWAEFSGTGVTVGRLTPATANGIIEGDFTWVAIQLGGEAFSRIARQVRDAGRGFIGTNKRRGLALAGVTAIFILGKAEYAGQPAVLG